MVHNFIIMLYTDDRRIPAPPINLQQSSEIDTRHGYFGHVILNITWDRPQSMIITFRKVMFRINQYTCIDVAYLDNFTVIVSPARGVDSRCGNESWSATVPRVSDANCHTVEPLNKGHIGDSVNSAVMSFIERLSSSIY